VEASSARRRQGAGADRLIAPGLVMASALSTQLGSAFAVKLFGLTSPTLVAFLRNLVGAGVLLALMAAWRRRPRGLDARLIVALGVALGTMNATFYEAIDRVPLGDAVAIEFIGPIVVAVVFSQSRRDLVFVALAALGILAFARPGPSHLSWLGLLFILAAACCWAVYLVLARRVATGPRRTDSLAMAMVVSAAWLLLPALLRSAGSLADPRVLALGAGIGIFSSALPYSIELAAMPRVSATVYGILLSLQPLVAALMGFALLGQRPGWLDGIGFALVIAASIGVNLADRGTAAAIDLPAEP
jgi:inner membrane transporter RhtA